MAVIIGMKMQFLHDSWIDPGMRLFSEIVFPMDYGMWQ